MDTANFAQQRRTIPGLQSLIARLFDVTLVVLGALAASQVRFEDITQSRIDTAFVAFAAAFTLVLFPTFGVYGSWRGRAGGYFHGVGADRRCRFPRAQQCEA